MSQRVRVLRVRTGRGGGRLLDGGMLVCLAGLVWSFAGVFVRLAPHLDPWQFLFYRNLGIACVFMAIAWKTGRRSTLAKLRSLSGAGLVVTIGLSVASTGFIIAIKTTTVANALFLSSCSPLVSSLLGYVVLSERLTRLQLVALTSGLAGLALIFDGGLAAGKIVGDLCALASAIGFAVSSTVMRRHPHLDFMPCLVACGVLVSLVAAATSLVAGDGLQTPPFDSGMAFLAGFLVIGLGYSLFLHAAPHVPAVGQTLLAQTETVFGPLWVWLLFGEVPARSTLEGGLVILFAIVLVVLGTDTKASSDVGSTGQQIGSGVQIGGPGGNGA